MADVLALSQRAYDSLRDEQRDVISRSCTLLPLDVPTIELAGGSVRCMIAGIHLDRRPGRSPTPTISLTRRPGARHHVVFQVQPFACCARLRP